MQYDIGNIYRESEYELSFQIWGITYGVAAMLRSIFIAEIETLAIGTVNVKKNTTSLDSHLLSEILRLIPLNSEDLSLDGSKLVMKISKFEGSVTKRYLVSVDNNVCSNLLYLDFEGLESNEFEIVKIKKNQTIDLECFVEKGTGKMNSKWAPVTTSTVFMPQNDGSFIFEIVGRGQLRAETILNRGLGILYEKLNVVV